MALPPPDASGEGAGFKECWRSEFLFPFRKVYGLANINVVIMTYGLLSALFGDDIWGELSRYALAVLFAVITWKYS
ncbi:MAG: hypothetical protein WCE63_14880 [Acidobacteriaceae bacterium]